MEKTKTEASDSLLMEQLEVLDWEALWDHLLARCAFLANVRYGVGWSSEDKKAFSRRIVSEVIEKIFVTKKRKWYNETTPDFKEFITSAVDSHFYNTLIKQDSETAENRDHIFDENSDGRPNVVQQLSTEELRTLVYDELKQAGATDDELMIFDCMADGVYKPKEIREELGISKEDFHNIFRKLKRKLKPIREKIAGYELR